MVLPKAGLNTSTSSAQALQWGICARFIRRGGSSIELLC